MVHDMPPKKKKQPQDIERAKVIYWVQKAIQGTPEADTFHKKLLKPDYGNYVSHEKLFSGEIKTKPFSPSRIWRLSPEVFNHNKKHQLNQSPYTYTTSTRGIRDYSATSGVDQSSVQMMMLNIKQILDQKKALNIEAAKLEKELAELEQRSAKNTMLQGLSLSSVLTHPVPIWNDQVASLRISISLSLSLSLLSSIVGQRPYLGEWAPRK